MSLDKFKDVRICESNTKWNNCITRENDIYQRNDDIRSEFTRDYNRILHCNAFRRLKHKTQVFFATSNDHICTRVEHVNHVSSVSYTLSKHLGLNTELTTAIAIGHDIGHAPFGHAGETYLREIISEKIEDTFWHEKNSLYFADNFETLPDIDGFERNLCLTYAVRDGIICHCGEVYDLALFPRSEYIDLESVNKASQYSPYTWEGCIVKIADKISYLGRDIEDAIALKILTHSQLKELSNILKTTLELNLHTLNNTVIMHQLMIDLCNESSPECGLRFSEKYYNYMKCINAFNYENIYNHRRIMAYKEYACLIIKSIFSVLEEFYDGDDTLEKLERYKELYPKLISFFIDWLLKYSSVRDFEKNQKVYQVRVGKLKNKILFDLKNQADYFRAIISFISGMTDSFAIKVFNEITSF